MALLATEMRSGVKSLLGVIRSNPMPENAERQSNITLRGQRML